jgi:hypothetical protein
MVADEPAKRRSLDEIKEHAMELREFAGFDWDGTRDDLELLWELREAFSRSVEKREAEMAASEPTVETELREPYELPERDAELLLAEVDSNLQETDVEVNQQVEKVENAERPL